MKRIFLATAISLTTIASTSFASTTIPKLITDMQEKGYFEIINSTPVKEVQGMTAIMIKNSSKAEYHIYWVDDKDHTIFTGDMVTKSEVNLTDIYYNKLIPSQADKFDVLFEKGLVLGDQIANKNTDNALFVFYEPFCGYCRKFHKELQPLINAGLNVQYIPVAWLRPNSADVIATIAKQKDVSKAIFMNDAGVLDITESPSPELRNKIQQNSIVMRDMGIGGTPGIVYRDVNGKVIVARSYTQEQLQFLYKDLMSRNKG